VALEATLNPNPCSHHGRLCSSSKVSTTAALLAKDVIHKWPKLHEPGSQVALVVFAIGDVLVVVGIASEEMPV
jgi:hypothetical protein